MTNEELATMAAQGDTESLHKLYFAVAPLLYKLIKRYFPLCKYKLAAPEDLLQCGYFIVLEAVKSFTAGSGFLFNSYLRYPTQNVCLRELGFKGKRQIETISLDTPVMDDEVLTLGDTIEDPNEDTYSYCELNDMRLIVRKEIDRLPSREKCLIYGTFYERKTTQELARELGWDIRLTKSVKYAAYNILRRSGNMQALRKVYQFHDNLTPECMIVSFGDSGLELL